MSVEIPGTMQILYTAQDGSLRAVSGRWEGRNQLALGEGASLAAVPGIPGQLQYSYTGENAVIHGEVPVAMTTSGGQGIPMVAAVEPGEETAPDPQRPSLIMRRAGTDPLWEIAKASGSTMEAIRNLNGFADEPRAGQMLLIPVQ